MLYYQIKELYPNIKDDEFTLQDDSNNQGAYIRSWKAVYSLPTDSELNLVQLQAQNILKYRELRLKRNELLLKSDWKIIRHKTQLDLGVTTTLNAEEYEALLRYMQALRDLPATVDINNIVFPSLE